MFLGADGGGTKTALCLVDQSGGIRAHTEVGGTYHATRGIEEVGRLLQEGVATVCRIAGIDREEIRFAFLGLPGYGESPTASPQLDALPAAVLGHHRYAVDNDMVCAWAGSLAGQDGINVISGTGSLAYAVRADRSVRVGGWGHLFGDEGSAYWIATRGLLAFARMSDGRQPAGPLAALLRDSLNLTSDLDLIDIVTTEWGGRREAIAGLCPLIVRAADHGDRSAQQIIDAAGGELAELAAAARVRLDFDDSLAVPVSFSGGVFASAHLRASFARSLARSPAPFELRQPAYPPVIGAAIRAALLAGTPLDDRALRRLSVTSPGDVRP